MKVTNIFSGLEEHSYKFLEEKLIEQHAYVELGDLFGITNEDMVPGLASKQELVAAREATLQYLLLLLKEGKLRVKVTIPRLATEEEVENTKKNLNDPWLEKNQGVGITCVTASTKIYTREEAEEAIESMREAWNDPKVPVTAFEMDVLFTLPENKFPGE